MSRNLTEELMTREQWQAYVPSSMHCYTCNGIYYAFYDTGSVRGCLIFSFGVDAGFVVSDQYCSCAYYEERLDSLFMVKFASTTNTLYEWGTGSAMTARWRSRDHRFFSGALMARAMVLASAYPVTFRLYADGVLKWTESVANGNPFPLPDGRNYKIAYEIEGAANVTSVRVASSLKELGDV